MTAVAGEIVLVEVKHWYRSRTLWLSIAGTVAGLGSLDLPAPWGSILAVAVSVAGAYLRAHTSAPIAGTPAADEAR